MVRVDTPLVGLFHANRSFNRRCAQKFVMKADTAWLVKIR